VRSQLLERTLAKSTLRPDVVSAAFASSGTDFMVTLAINNVVQLVLMAEASEVERHLEQGAAHIAKRIELSFVHDSRRSVFELMTPEQEKEWESFEWDDLDYPGINKKRGETKEGPNRWTAERQFRELREEVPTLEERRVNQGSTALTTDVQEVRALKRFLVPVPGSPGHKLLPDAAAAFARMRTAAALDGVKVQIGKSPIDAFRSIEASEKLSEEVGAAQMVASGLSSHNFGAAIDVYLSTPNLEVTEITTTMLNVQKMRSSPVYKWLALHAHEFGWYPWNHEPWHWEYNPPGFPERVQAMLAETP
jgi:hypothetical protein